MELISFVDYRKKANVNKAKNGDKEAFLSLIDENRLNIYRVARGILSSMEDIQDAIQNTIIKAFQNINTLKNDDFFRTWIIRILINECNEIIRKNKKNTNQEIVQGNGEHNDNYEDLDITKAINELSEELRITTVLFYFEDMSTRDISKILDVPEGTVRSRLTRARVRLREVIGEV
ncbi:MAG: sigma-70 family RNA polymerase sigma factor [Clostridium sp.]